MIQKESPLLHLQPTCEGIYTSSPVLVQEKQGFIKLMSVNEVKK